MTWATDSDGVRRFSHVEIEINTHCDCKCWGCDRFVAACPTLSMPVEQVRHFVEESFALDWVWERMHILGGEPTLHGQFREIVVELLRYRERYPDTIIKVLSNGHGRVQERLAWLEGHNVQVAIEGKTPGEEPAWFDNMRFAPMDANPSYATVPPCYLFGLTGCGLGLTKHGFFLCGAGASIARVTGADIGVMKLEDVTYATMLEQSKALCRLCGRWTAHERDMPKKITDTGKVASAFWEEALTDWKPLPMSTYGEGSLAPSTSYPIDPVSGNIVLEEGLPVLTTSLAAVHSTLDLTDLSEQVVVVASGSSLAGSGVGHFIDSFGTVMRINRPILEGHEEDVGSKTDIIMLFPGMAIMEALVADDWFPDFMPCKLWLNHTRDLLYENEYKAGGDMHRMNELLREFLVMRKWSADDFISYAEGIALDSTAPDQMVTHDVLIEVRKRYGYAKPYKGPPTGVSAIILLKQMLPDYQPIFVAGYNMSYTPHYYEGNPFDNSHDVFHDRTVMQAWVDEGSVIPLTLPDDSNVAETGHPKAVT